MKLSNILSKEYICLDLKGTSKEEIISNLVDLLSGSDNIIDKEQYKKDVIEREKQSTTGIGEGIAIPHGKSKGIKKALMGIGISKEGLEFESLDGKKSNLFFILGVPESKNDEHIKIISNISRLIMKDEVKNKILNAVTVDEVYEALDEGQLKLDEDNSQENLTEEFPKVLCVTACPTGIAHTFMAADALLKAGKDMNILVKVETNGADGVQNKLTNEEIANAEGIIIAADKTVSLNRFKGKKLIFSKVSEGIHKPKELIKKVLKDDIKIFEGTDKEEFSQSQTGDKGIFRQAYKHLMAGVSNMLPFVIAGGILIAFAFLFDDYSIDPAKFGSNRPFSAFLKSIGDVAFSFMIPILSAFIANSIADKPGIVVGFVGGALANSGGSGFLGALVAGFLSGFIANFLKKILKSLPKSLDGVKNILFYPLLGVLIIGSIMILIVNGPVGFLNTSITNFLNSLSSTSRVFLGLLLGGMMAIDMGGPINKAAYVFGVAAIQSQQFEIMAAVMAGGMVPPLGIALATTFMKSRFTKEQREAGITNYILGLSFITEGAIPFAASNPIRVIPSLVVGSSVAGALSMLFKCTLRAPHGGVFVIPLVGNALMYIVSIIIGAVISMGLLGLLLPKVNE